GEPEHPPVDSEAPVVAVVVVQASLAVVGPHQREIVSDPDHDLVGTLHHQVAGGRIDVDPLPRRSALQRGADLALRAEHRWGTVCHPEGRPRAARRHATPLSWDSAPFSGETRISLGGRAKHQGMQHRGEFAQVLRHERVHRYYRTLSMYLVKASSRSIVSGLIGSTR